MLGSSSVADLRSMPLGFGGRSLFAKPGPEAGKLGRWPAFARSMAAAKGEAMLVTDCDLP